MISSPSAIILSISGETGAENRMGSTREMPIYWNYEND
jgi:hypothetical protein